MYTDAVSVTGKVGAVNIDSVVVTLAGPRKPSETVTHIYLTSTLDFGYKNFNPLIPTVAARRQQ